MHIQLPNAFTVRSVIRTGLSFLPGLFACPVIRPFIHLYP